MAKFYVSCGACRFVTSAVESQSAALWSIHQFIAGRVDLDSIDWSDVRMIDRADLIEAMLELDDTVRVSEIGFSGTEAGTFDTAEILNEWNALVVVVDRLQRRLDASGSPIR